MKIKFTSLFFALYLLLVVGKTAVAQNELDDKLNKIDGNIEKITITSDGKEYSFEGSNAEKLFQRMKQGSSHSFIWNTSEDDSMKKKIVIINADGKEEVLEIESGDDDVFIVKTEKDLDSISGGIQKKVIVDVENGNKKVTVTTRENGEEKTEVYEGKEAEEYIEKMKAENMDINISIDENKDGKKVKKIIIETDKEVE